MTSSTLGARQLRYKAFQEFLSSATESFKSLCNNNPEANRFKAIYSLCTCPGGRQGGKNARQLEVFFGARPFDSQENFDSTARPSLKLLSERGATLEFVRDDLGRVHVFLYPAVSEGMKPIEDAIELKIVGDPADLAKGTVLSRHFRWLVAYMQCTCLEGAPTFRDRITVAKLRLLHRRSVDGRMWDSRISVAAREVIKWVFTVGLSGTLLAAIQWTASTHRPMAVVEVSAEPTDTRQQRADLIRLGKKPPSGWKQ